VGAAVLAISGLIGGERRNPSPRRHLSKQSRLTKAGIDQAIVTALHTHLPQNESLPVGGSPMTRDEVAAQFQGRIDAGNKVTTTKAAWQFAGLTYREVDVRTEIVLRDLRAVIIGRFGADSPVLADFKMAPRKKAVLTPEQKAAAVEKRMATRRARGTMGPKAKLKITGETAAAQAAADESAKKAP
jgi:hypothetical protein